MKLKLIEPGFEGFTGEMFGIPFEGGVSTRTVVSFEAMRIGAAIRVVDAATESQVSPGVMLLEMNTVEMPVGAETEQTEETVESVEVQTEDEGTDGAGAEGEAAAEEASQEQPKSEALTREQLGHIADAEGIEGLRRIAEPLNVRARSIADLIEGILAAQAKA